MSPKTKESHRDPMLDSFSKLLEIGKLPIVREFVLLMSLLFVRVAPEIPISLKRSYSGPDGLRAGIIGFSITFFFTFIVNLIATSLNGTLSGTNPEIIYFLDDKWNLFLYAFICPIYVGLTCWLVVIVIKGWGEINDYKDNEILKSARNNGFKIIKAFLLGMLILSVAFLLTTNYINDVISLKDQRIFYWFMTEKSHELRALGVYYFLLNFSLLMVTLIAFTFFMSIYRLLWNVGNALESRKSIGKLEFETLKTKLSAFTEGYLVTKGIIAAYIINLYVWAESPLGEGTAENFIIALVLMTIIGFVFVSFPRYYVELQWYKLKLRSPNSKILNLGREDLRTYYIKMTAIYIDRIFLSGFVVYTVKYIIDKI